MMRKIFSLFFVIVLCAASISLFFEVSKTIQREGRKIPPETISIVERKNTFSTTTVSAEKTDVAVPAKKNTPERVSNAVQETVSTIQTKPLPVVENSTQKTPVVVSPTEKPLARISPVTTTSGVVKEDEVLSWTNAKRAENGATPLVRNSMLDLAARVKAEDMLARQYFEHVSPTGKDAGDLVTEAGYEYLLVGENLAYGDFTDAKDLVDAWMNSPGHRANILKARYEEIGISAILGVYQGHKVWMAVQEFGRPASSCPAPSNAVKQEIDADKAEYTVLSDQVKTMLLQMNTLEANGDIAGFNALVPTYNEMVANINALVEKISTLIGSYNEQVKVYKACVEM